MAIAPLTHLGTVPIASFMRRHWQRRPLLVRNALPHFVAPVDETVLFRLASRADVEARLVTSFDGWRMRTGPIARRQIPALSRPRWTLLVQGLDQHDDRAADLLERFRFVTDARLDDLMVSYASDGGGVGPHIDDYDVFLLQARGRRRWRIGKGDARDFVPDLPLKILRRFKVEQDWVLEPGDLLYLPPGIAHEGTAVGDGCLTCSIGFRAPAWRELLEPWLDVLARRPTPAGRYADPGTSPTRKPAHLPNAFVESAFKALTRVPPTRAEARALLLTFLTEPKPNITFARPRRAVSMRELRTRARRGGLRLDRRTRMLYSGTAIAINGELLESTDKDPSLMHLLADKRSLDPAHLGARAVPWWNEFASWHGAGWLHLS
jgi:50S ribosomal protein L16 3-hydroxylase